MSEQFFIPPNFNLGTAWFADAVNPAILKIGANIDGLKFEPDDRRMLRELKDKRVLFFSNHPTQAEPVLAWQVANAMGSRFNYMATRRAFDYFNGMLGTLFAQTGAFSVIPGIPCVSRGACSRTRPASWCCIPKVNPCAGRTTA